MAEDQRVEIEVAVVGNAAGDLEEIQVQQLELTSSAGKLRAAIGKLEKAEGDHSQELASLRRQLVATKQAQADLNAAYRNAAQPADTLSTKTTRMSKGFGELAGTLGDIGPVVSSVAPKIGGLADVIGAVGTLATGAAGSFGPWGIAIAAVGTAVAVAIPLFSELADSVDDSAEARKRDAEAAQAQISVQEQLLRLADERLYKQRLYSGQLSSDTINDEIARLTSLEAVINEQLDTRRRNDARLREIAAGIREMGFSPTIEQAHTGSREFRRTLQTLINERERLQASNEQLLVASRDDANRMLQANAEEVRRLMSALQLAGNRERSAAQVEEAAQPSSRPPASESIGGGSSSGGSTSQARQSQPENPETLQDIEIELGAERAAERRAELQAEAAAAREAAEATARLNAERAAFFGARARLETSRSLSDAIGSGAFDKAESLIDRMENTLGERPGKDAPIEEWRAYLEQLDRVQAAEESLAEARQRSADSAAAQARAQFEIIRSDAETMLGPAVSGITGALSEVLAGTKSAGEAFKGFLSSFLEMIAQKATLEAISEYAAAIGSFATYDYSGGALHLAAGIAWTGVAVAAGAGAIATKPAEAKPRSPDQGSQQPQSTTPRQVVFNMNGPFVTAGTRAELGREFGTLVREGERRFGS